MALRHDDLDDGAPMYLVKDDYQKALATIGTIAADLGADYAVVDEREKPDQGILTNLMIRRRPKTVEDLLEIRIAVVGNVVCLLGLGDEIEIATGA